MRQYCETLKRPFYARWVLWAGVPIFLLQNMNLSLPRPLVPLPFPIHLTPPFLISHTATSP
jgi:hypothetical protein